MIQGEEEIIDAETKLLINSDRGSKGLNAIEGAD